MGSEGGAKQGNYVIKIPLCWEFILIIVGIKII